MNAASTPMERGLPGRQAEVAPGQAAAAGADLVRDLPQRERGRGVWVAEHQRHPRVAALAQPDVERHLAEQGYLGPAQAAERGRHGGSAARAEHFRLLAAVRADEVRHVLDDPGDALMRLRGDRPGPFGYLG